MNYSVSAICNKGNGDCDCQQNYDGRICDECADLTYGGFPSCNGKNLKFYY